MGKKIAGFIAAMLLLTFPAAAAEIEPPAYDLPMLPQEYSLMSEYICLGEDPEAIGLMSNTVENIEGAIQALRAGMLRQDTEIDITPYRIKLSTFPKLSDYVRFRYPELFAGTTKSYYYSGEYVTRVINSYSMTGAEYEAAKAFYEGELDRITSLVDSSWSREKKILFLNDYVTTHYEYDLGLTIRDAYTFLKEGIGVCQSYTLLMEGLLDRLNIPVSYVYSKNANHIWNMVQMEDGKWYQLDATWNDPTNSRYMVSHKYILVSDAQMNDHLVEGKTKDWVYGTQVFSEDTNSPCTSATYDNYFWREAASPFVVVNGSFYYISSNSINRWDGGGEPTYVAKPTCNYWNSGLTFYNGMLYYNTYWTLERYSFYTGEVESLPFTEPQEFSWFMGTQLRIQADGTLAIDAQYSTGQTSENSLYCDNLLTNIAPYETAGNGCMYCFDGERFVFNVPESSHKLIAAWYNDNGMLLSSGVYDQKGTSIPALGAQKVKLIVVNGSWSPVETAELLVQDELFPWRVNK